MFHSEVEEWLYSIGLEELYPYFVADGLTSLEQVRLMRQSDIDAIVDRKGLFTFSFFAGAFFCWPLPGTVDSAWP